MRLDSCYSAGYAAPSPRGSLPADHTPVPSTGSTVYRMIWPRPNMPLSVPRTTSTLWPSSRRPSTVSSGMPSSTLTVQSKSSSRSGRPAMMQTRGASSVCCGERRATSWPRSTWTWPCGCMKPPMTPKALCSDPSAWFVAMAGMMVWYGLLRGVSRFGWSASRLKLAPRFCSVKPQPWGMMQVPKPP
ncbi:hypothetical protein CTA2_12119 [Colletotrichum tanaceti]|nr:hypothetical protein CTA2_12119 [Colletotrichum tanaceti]